MSTSTTTEVTIDRVVAAARRGGIELDADATGRGARAQVKDFEVLVVLLESVMIVRADASTTVASDTPDPTLYLAANQVNCSLSGVRAIVVNREETIRLRTESEIQVAAGLSDDQLHGALTRAVDSVVTAQDALAVAAEQLGELGDRS